MYKEIIKPQVNFFSKTHILRTNANFNFPHTNCWSLKTGKVYQRSNKEIVPARVIIMEECQCACGEQLTREEKKEIFERFNNLKSHEKQNIYLQGCIRNSEMQRLITGEEKSNFTYSLSLSPRQIFTCRKFFCGIHGIKPYRLRTKSTLSLKIFVSIKFEGFKRHLAKNSYKF